jgi:deazaflavin-dependent oxidoreductase (nitroreductase family)
LNTRDSYSEEIMADAATDGINGFNDKILAEFRANGGRVSGSLAGTPMILIHHIGAKSGIERVTPLACSPQDDGRIVIVASNGGSPTHPSWYYNPRANPRIEVEVGTETFTVLAEELDGTARAELWLNSSDAGTAGSLAGTPASVGGHGSWTPQPRAERRSYLLGRVAVRPPAA